MKIVVDAMGGDYAPQSVIKGVVEALKELDVDIALVGLQDKIEAELANHTYSKERLEIIHAPEIVEMKDSATVTLRKKKKSSISVGINLLKDPQYQAFISAGNTGAVVAASTIYLGMIPGVARPGIGLVIPTLKDFSFIIDVGATTDPKAKHLQQWALMAEIYSHVVLGVDNPKVGLLNIGEEASKGTGFAKETHKFMADRLKNFIGNIEANEIFMGTCDCIICDGFAGNIVIKVAQSLMEGAAALLRREIKKSPIALLGAALMKSRLNHIKRHADYSEYGGAPLLGVNGIVMISHGRSSPKAIKNAIRAARGEIEHNIIASIRKEIGE
ncbi:MAG: phosphate acyltransferase PlsX [Candidatus Omnitrophica bacterium]|nr:phosphate acyltransferase PlsX [Candidatus Omnitrophota bacterium]